MPAVRSRTLLEAESLIGRDQLCRLLGVDAATLEKWTSGEEEPPQSVFLKAVDIVLERRQQH